MIEITHTRAGPGLAKMEKYLILAKLLDLFFDTFVLV